MKIVLNIHYKHALGKNNFSINNLRGLCFSPSQPDIGIYFLSEHTLKHLNLYR